MGFFDLPSMMALMMSPTMFCKMRTKMAAKHCSVIIRPPKPMVTWTSMEKRKADVKDLRGRRELVSKNLLHVLTKGVTTCDGDL